MAGHLAWLAVLLFLNSVFIKSQICSNALDKFPSDHLHLILMGHLVD